MTFDYARARSTAERLIARFGAPALLRKQGWRTGPASAPVFSGRSVQPITVVDLGIKTKRREGGTAEETVRTLYVSTEGLPTVADQPVVPEIGDRIAIVGDADEAFATDDAIWKARSHEIMAVEPLSPAGIVVFWECDLRV